MSASENKLRMQRIFDELSRGDARSFVESLADDVCWTVIGTSRWSGTYRGKQDVIERLLRPVGALLVHRHKLHARRFVAEDDMVVVELRGENVSKRGVPYNNSYCYVCRLAGGRIVELMEYADTELFTAALSA